MSTALRSSHWHRVAGLKPRLRPHVRIHRHRYRNALWYVVEDRAAGKHHRFGLAAYRVIANLDGRRSLQEIWEALSHDGGEAMPSQDDVVQLLGQLNAADLVSTDAAVDVAELFERHRKQNRQRWMQRLANPLAMRFPLLDPDRFLTRLIAMVQYMPTWVWLVLGCLPVGLAASQVPAHWQKLTQNFNDQLIAADNVVLLGVAFMLMKLCHELAHGIALKRRGAEVHEMGLMLLIFYPVPYVDASGASAFVRKWDRVAVGAAGMVMEVWLAALAMLGWLVLEPGLLRSLLYNVMVVGSVSTVLFNANPLLRFDGYYMLMDAIDIPNLGQRANAWWQHLLRRRGFGIPEDPPEALPAERRWFAAYAPAALVYRVTLTLSIAWFVGQQYFFLGVLLAAWSLGHGLVWPLLRGYGRLWSDPQVTSRARRVVMVAGGGPMLVAAGLFVLPMPHHTRAQGVVALPEQAVLRAGAAGFVHAVHAEHGAQLQAGDTVMNSISPTLQAEHRVRAASVEIKQAELDAVWGVNPSATGRLVEELAREKASLARLTNELERLVLRSGATGRLLVDQPADLPGRHLRQGEAVGYVVGVVKPIVRVAVSQGHVDLVRAATRSVAVRMPQAFDDELAGRLVREVPGGGTDLPSAALGPRGGGPFTVDPRDDKGLTALESVFMFEIELTVEQAAVHLGSRAWVAFEHPPEPLGWRLMRLLRRQLLSHFQL